MSVRLTLVFGFLLVFGAAVITGEILKRCAEPETFVPPPPAARSAEGKK